MHKYLATVFHLNIFYFIHASTSAHKHAHSHRSPGCLPAQVRFMNCNMDLHNKSTSFSERILWCNVYIVIACLTHETFDKIHILNPFFQWRCNSFFVLTRENGHTIRVSRIWFDYFENEKHVFFPNAWWMLKSDDRLIDLK